MVVTTCYVVVERVENAKTKDGIIVPNSSQGKSDRGVIVQSNLTEDIGETVLIPKEIYQEFEHEGRKLLVLEIAKVAVIF